MTTLRSFLALLTACRRSRSTNIGVLREPIESFIAPQLSFHPIQRSLLCQTSANCFHRFATMAAQVLDLVLHFFLGDFDIFTRRDAIDDQFSFHVVRRAILLFP